MNSLDGQLFPWRRRRACDVVTISATSLDGGKMFKIVFLIVLFALGTTSASAITEEEMRLAIADKNHCTKEKVRNVQYRDRCTPVCGHIGGTTYSCSLPDPLFIGYEPECQDRVTKENELINQYNAAVDGCPIKRKDREEAAPSPTTRRPTAAASPSHTRSGNSASHPNMSDAEYQCRLSCTGPSDSLTTRCGHLAHAVYQTPKTFTDPGLNARWRACQKAVIAEEETYFNKCARSCSPN
jgi:hypothetical protein